LAIARGADPLQAHRQEEQSAADVPTFGAYALALVERIEEGFSNPKHRQQWRNTLKTYCGPIWHLPMDQVDIGGVLACLPDLADETGNSFAGARADRAHLKRS
jgi:hypothetical protein